MSYSNILKCYICNIPGIAPRAAIYIFDSKNDAPSGKPLSAIISQILDKPLSKFTAHSYVICRKCLEDCHAFDSMQIRIADIKRDLISKFKDTLKVYNIQYDGSEDLPTSPVPTPVKVTSAPTKKQVVLPASKLKPLPPNYLILNSNLKSGIPVLSNGKVTLSAIGLSGTTTKSINLRSPAKTILKPQATSSIIATAINNIMINTTSSFDLNVNQTLPKNLFTSPDKKGDDCNLELNRVIAELGDRQEQAMEIDEECTSTNEGVAASVTEEKKSVIEIKNENEQVKDALINIEILPNVDQDNNMSIKKEKNTEKETDYVVGKMEIYNNLGEEDGSIIMEQDENGKVLRVVSGQKIVYDDNEISLILPGSDNEDMHNEGSDDQDRNDSQDSNDESQIELQMSGDEETANAIIEAAQKQGGAFIKVKSGEMFKVESVETEQKVHTTEDTQYIVEKVGENYKCVLCDNITDEDGGKVSFIGNSYSVMRHVRQKHNACVYICGICGEVIRRRSDYNEHTVMHAAQSSGKEITDKHECSQCSKKFISESSLLEHVMFSHNKMKPYSCTICDKTFATKYTHQSHMKTHEDRTRQFQCSMCHKSFYTQYNLIQHVKTHSGLKPFLCKICDKSFSTQHNLEVHGIVHTGNKPFVCGVCQKAFARRAEIKDHMRTHTGERPFSCDMCTATFSQRSNLQSHKRATHFNDKRYACAHCDKRFKRRRLLDYHIKATHTGERPHTCEVCRATFVYPEHYKKHIRIHSGEKPFSCEICGKSFNSRDNRNSHRFIHSDKKPYECLICGAGFMRKPLLYAHMNASGHLSETIVVNQPKVINSEDASDNEMIETVSGDHHQEVDPILIMESNILNAIEESDLQSGNDNSNTATEDSSTRALYTSEKRYILQQDGDQIYTVNFEGTSDSGRQIFDSDDLTENMIATTSVKTEPGMSKTIEQQDNNIQIMAKDVNGALVQLVQMQLPGGQNGWVAINHE